MIKLIISDLDGTLLDSSLRISEHNLREIKRIQSHGVLFTIATGRPYDLIKAYIEMLELKLPIITCNGARIVMPDGKKDVFNAYLPVKDVRALIEQCYSRGHHWLAYSSRGIITTITDFTKTYLKRNDDLPINLQARYVLIDRSNQLRPDEKINKFLIIEKDKERYMETCEQITSKKGLNCERSQESYIDVMPKGINKSVGVEKIISEMNIKAEHVAAFGDQENDLQMLKFVGLPITLQNGIDALKEIAVFTGRSNEDSGVASGISWIFHNHFDGELRR